MELGVREVGWEEKDVLEKLARISSSPFHCPAWHRHFDGRSRPFCFFDRGGNVVGGFYLFREKRGGVTILRNPPLTPSVGPFLATQASNASAMLAQRREAAALMRDAVRRQRSAVVMLGLDRDWTDVLPFIWSGFKVSVASTFLLDLTEPEEALWKRLSGERRKSIRKAEADGLAATVVARHPAVEPIIRQTFARNGLKRALELVPRLLASEDDCWGRFCVVAERQGRVVAAVFCVTGGQSCVYLLGGFDEAERHHGAVSLCLWKAAQEARVRGCRVFDFEGSLVEHVDRFFRGFGGEHRMSLRVLKAWYPLEVLLGLSHRSLF